MPVTHFALSPTSGAPAHRQIVEQIKVGLLTGSLRPGEMLPSIRDLKREIGVTEAVVRRAYAQLARQGVVTLMHGKGVQVSRRLNYGGTQDLVEQYEAVVDEALAKAQKDGLLLSCFARLLAAKARTIESASHPLVYVDATEALAEERASTISTAWGIHVQGVSLDSLKPLLVKIPRPMRILTNYYRHSQVLALARKSGVPVIPMGLAYASAMVRRIEGLRKGSTVLLIVDPADADRADRMIEDYRQRFTTRALRFTASPWRGDADFQRHVRDRGCALVLVSARLWEHLPARTKRRGTVMRTQMEFAPADLEAARIEAGVIA
jgi:GntR family transcriptional regulator